MSKAVIGTVAIGVCAIGLYAQSPPPSRDDIKANQRDGLNYVRIRPGTFQMGCSDGDDECTSAEKPSHDVTSKGPFGWARLKQR